ncbi:uncharacterized protein si:dkey-246e1.3 isoform X2 [Scophthalmus maximus]|uniref:uncharacterized protein si:dkey-246e1.3 isoform X2 n=1 Tax=Scophthalmus maximus TaxID=52904 RepID=UPI001FA91E84|nr:uncharacterized protein si:dkey-246e1.3 isoform X2 [Scophthalmus maximus]
MSGAQQDRAMTADSLRLNGTTALGLRDEEMDTAAFEFKVFNIVIIALALCVLTVTGLYCIIVCYNRTRQSKRAHVYESAVTRGDPVDPVAVRAVKRSTSFINPLTFLRKPEAAKDNSRIYYIYSNPLPVGVKEEEEEVNVPQRSGEKTAWPLPLSIQEYASDPNSGIILDPPVFYMQL